MSLLVKQIDESIIKRQLCAVYMSTAVCYICFINDYDEEFLKITYLDFVSNSEYGKVGRMVKETLGEEQLGIINLESQEEIDAIDRFFCQKIIRLNMVDSIDFGVEYAITGATTDYVNHYRDNVLRTIIDEIKETEAAKKAAKTKTNRKRVSQTNNTSGS